MDDDDVGLHRRSLTGCDEKPDRADRRGGRRFAREETSAHDAPVTAFPTSLARHLHSRRRMVIDARDAIACAVLIPLLPIPGGHDPADFEVVYTLRSEHLPSHKGQVAFPGGKCHGVEELVDTALRESAEEIGIVPANVEVLGCLDDVSTMAGQFVITPWVGVLPAGCRFEANPHEVADIFAVPLSRLGDPRHHTSTSREWGGNAYRLPAITAGRHEIWGATHEITLNFLERIREAREHAAGRS
jgi:8-oxo-dGTP pyrophosphatase MutT (NUDIX family)